LSGKNLVCCKYHSVFIIIFFNNFPSVFCNYLENCWEIRRMTSIFSRYRFTIKKCALRSAVRHSCPATEKIKGAVHEIPGKYVESPTHRDIENHRFRIQRTRKDTAILPESIKPGRGRGRHCAYTSHRDQ
jgi:hypothetical protein